MATKKAVKKAVKSATKKSAVSRESTSSTALEDRMAKLERKVSQLAVKVAKLEEVVGPDGTPVVN